MVGIYFPLLLLTTCLWQIDSSSLGTVCDIDSDCTTEDAVCYHQYHGCNRGECACDLHYYPYNSQCRPKREIGEACDYDQDCTITTEYSQCVGSKCQCEGGTDWSVYHNNGKDQDDRKYCYKAKLEEICGDKSECLAYQVNNGAANCVVDNNENLCRCDVEFEQDGEHCNPVTYGGSCILPDDTEKECESNSVCSTTTETCQCQDDEEWNTSYKRCHHIDAENVNGGDSCNDQFNTQNGLICPVNNVCDSCPEGGQDICLESNGVKKITLHGLLITLNVFIFITYII